jgi:hypothetical protein
MAIFPAGELVPPFAIEPTVEYSRSSGFSLGYRVLS